MLTSLFRLVTLVQQMQRNNLNVHYKNVYPMKYVPT